MNYAVMKSMFGDYWVGKTALPIRGDSIFSTFDEAVKEAMSRNDSITNAEELEATLESECEVISKEMEKWIVGDK